MVQFPQADAETLQKGIKPARLVPPVIAEVL